MESTQQEAGRSRLAVPPAAALRRFNRGRDAALLGAVSAVILLLPLADLVTNWQRVLELSGHDFNLYLDAAARWLASGSFYPPEELRGTFTDDGNRILYPPTALLLLGPLAWLPRGLAGVIWWAVPIIGLGLQVARFRPVPIVWPFLAICVAWPPTLLTVAVWNSAPLFVGFLALGTMYHWPSALIGLKPAVLPFAFWGANHRSWWIAVGALALLSLSFGAMWLDWFQVLRNSSVGGIWHSVDQFPIFLIPILIWLGRSRERFAGSDGSMGFRLNRA